MAETDPFTPEISVNWFTLYKLCQVFQNQHSINITTAEFGKYLNLSQQTASRRIRELEHLGWIKKKQEGKSHKILITEKGTNVLFNIYKNLKSMLQSILIIGEVTEGMHEGGYYVAIKGYYDQFKSKLGFEPYKGTLNLKLSDIDNEMLREKLNNMKPVIIDGFKDQNREYGPVKCYDVYISRLDNKNNIKRAAILDIQRTHHQKNIIEILAKPYLRDCFNLKDGDKLILNFNHPKDLET